MRRGKSELHPVRRPMRRQGVEMGTRQLRVLVADDDAAVRDQLTRIVVELGHRIDTAPDGRACLKQASQTTYDLIFLDLFMPVLDGVHVLLNLREHPTTTAVVAMSSLDEQSIIANLLKAGAAAYLIKPLGEHTVREVIGRVAAGTIFSPTEVISEVTPRQADANLQS